MNQTKTFLLLLLCFFSAATCFAASVVIYNDSIYPLKAEIYSADGSKMGAVEVQTQHQSSWQDPSPANTNYPLTPYTVIFSCKSGGQYGIVSGVNSGAWVTASQAQGQRFCKQEKNNQGQNQQQQQPSQNQQDFQQDFQLNPP
ncbi:hypothetical protein [Simkania negevensis]|uniref:Uncharacterized protein n=1 Tax=Simkania negevensis (strain ATCC VR-1471 / DSM 27360 / Z) TaxID=331113 RepID=F8L4E4_SIMNZ|nr:hypothetical protein [Simkania negevensis]CCB90195.1 unknown protein [Simkania negevensis Z]